MKRGEAFDLLAELAKEPSFGMTKEEMEEGLSPKAYTGRCASQVEAFVKETLPVYENAGDMDFDIPV